MSLYLPTDKEPYHQANLDANYLSLTRQVRGRGREQMTWYTYVLIQSFELQC